MTRNAGASDDDGARPRAQLVAEYGRYDADRTRAIAEFDAGHRDRAVADAGRHDRARAARCASWRATLITLRRDEVTARLSEADRVWQHALAALAVAVMLAIFGALGGGYMLARRVARPLYDLVLRAESAAGGTRVEVSGRRRDRRARPST